MKKTMTSSIAMTAVTLGSLSLLACGGGDDGNADNTDVTTDDVPDVDAAPQPDAEVVSTCTDITVGEYTLSQADGTNAAYNFTINEDLGTGTPAFGQIELYSDFGKANFVGTFDLGSAGQDDNYSTCATCFRILGPNAAGDAIEKQWFQTGGSVTFTADPLTGTLEGTVTNLAMTEVTIDDSFVSTPVAGGSCLSFDALTLTLIPAAWTCDDAAFNDGATCDCECGGVDPDCSIADAPLTGCDAGQVCGAEGTCETPPANDLCGGAVALTVDAAATVGTNISATNNFDNGLEIEACTGYSQVGGDVTYSVTLTAGQNITVTVTPEAGNADLDLALGLLGPGDATVCDADPVACGAGADAGLGGDPETFSFTAATAGTYFIIVDSFFASGVQGQGNFEISVVNTPA